MSPTHNQWVVYLTLLKAISKSFQEKKMPFLYTYYRLRAWWQLLFLCQPLHIYYVCKNVPTVNSSKNTFISSFLFFGFAFTLRYHETSDLGRTRIWNVARTGRCQFFLAKAPGYYHIKNSQFLCRYNRLFLFNNVSHHTHQY